MTESDPWAQYAGLQAEADCSRLNFTAWAHEAALDKILERIEAGQIISEIQTENLVSTQRTKLRNRNRLIGENVSRLFEAANDNEPRCHARLMLGWCRQQCTRREWRVLLMMACGYSTEEIGRCLGVAAGTIKTWTFRARRKLTA